MRKLFIMLVVSITMLAIQKPAEATHLAGMDLTYECVGGYQYEITLAFYRDCSGVSAPPSATIQFQCASSPLYNFSVTAQPVPGTGGEVTPGCSAMPTTCSTGSGYGLQEYIYKATVTLPPCADWTMSYNMCCRNPSNTISNPTGAGAYTEAFLNNLNAPCNSSPSFTNLPVTIMCSQQTSCYNHGAYDKDGDSLSYTFVTPFDDGPGGAQPYVTWIPPYNSQQPLPSNPPITLDPVTGDICMTPTQNVISPMAVKIEEYRTINGVVTLIGVIYRDLQINVVTCVNQLPQLSGMDTTLINGYNPNDTTYLSEMCLGTTANFAIWGYDPDTANPTNIGNPEIFSLSWNSGIPNGNFQTFNQQTDSAYAIFTWTPNASDVSNTPKCFTVNIHDEACPYYGSQTFSYCLIVRGMFVEIGEDTLACQGETIKFFASADTTTVNYIWKVDGIPTGTPLSDTTYTLNTSTLTPGLHIVGIETNDGGTTISCPGVDNLKVNVVYQPDVDFGPDTMVCAPTNVVLDAGPGQTYMWNTGDTTQTITTSFSAYYTCLVDGGVGTRCTDRDSIYVRIVPFPVVDIGADTCVEDPIQVTAIVQPFPLESPYLEWSDGTIGYSITPTISGVYSVTVTFEPGSGCETVESKTVNIIKVDLGEDVEICQHEDLTIKAPEPPFGHSYDYIWSPGGQTTSYIVLSDEDEGVYTYTVDVGGGCVGDITVTVFDCPITIPNVITPNADGFNDDFYIDGIDSYPGSELIIYNRWGKKVYESTSYSSANAWDAANNSEGVYYYRLILNRGQRPPREYSGSLTVLR